MFRGEWPTRTRDEDARDCGSLTVELVVLTPLVVLFLLLAVAFGRYEVTRQEVVAAARTAAEEAAVAISASAAQADARYAAIPVLDSQHICTAPSVIVDTTNFIPGGSVRVTVSCQVSLADLSLPGIPGTVDVQVVQSAPLDPFRTFRP